MSAVSQGETLPSRTFGPFSAAAIAAYAQASGDNNPLHSDPEIAARAGLARPPVHGMLVMACFEPFLAGWRPGSRVKKLGAKFIKPLLSDEAVVVSGKVVKAAADGVCVLRLSAKRDNGDLVCLAEAFVVP